MEQISEKKLSLAHAWEKWSTSRESTPKKHQQEPFGHFMLELTMEVGQFLLIQ